MSAPLLAEGGSLGLSLLAASVVGIGFGFALERAGLGSACKLIGQFYGRDLSVLKVMFSALLVAMLGVFWLGYFGWLDVSAVYVPDTFLWPQAFGAALFGAGLIVAGLCPGTACVSAASGRIDGLFVLFGLLVGMLTVGLGLHRYQAFFESSARGAWTLPQLLGLPYGVVVAAVVVVALFAFVACEWFERRQP
ncbi:MAG: YeeE/YedE thiosulfate transporter family protein [Pseudomarimonas sp.]